MTCVCFLMYCWGSTLGLGLTLPFFSENYIAVQNGELLIMLTWFVSEEALEKRTTKENIYIYILYTHPSIRG